MTPEAEPNEGRLTVTLDTFDCRCCANATNSTTLSYEGGEWVHNRCGGPVPTEAAERADERLANGEGEHDHAEKKAEAFAESLKPMLEDGDDEE